ncbi:hypothetical protein ADK55_21895 [Streptomyces sp. WM4235]|nr:hypothetical protein ADK55_21895 [Streptomyces sp. WM4235]
MARSSPLATVRSTPRRAATPPGYSLVTPVSSTTVVAGRSASGSAGGSAGGSARRSADGAPGRSQGRVVVSCVGVGVGVAGGVSCGVSGVSCAVMWWAPPRACPP